MDGWMCATAAGAATGAIFRGSAATMEGKNVPGVICLVLSGWVNPLVGMYLVLCLWPRLARIRIAIAVGVLICLTATWVFLAIARMEPMIGHYLWAVGTLMILAGAVTGRQQKKDTEAPATGRTAAP
jgi:NhaP-type Na+/H+ or K+/H+ antiporter